MIDDTILTILLSGAGTFALRWLPLRQARRTGATEGASSPLQLWLAGVGPAAIAALLVVSLWEPLTAGVGLTRPAIALLSLCAIAAVRFLLRGGVAAPTLAGALCYGLLLQLMEYA